MLITCDKCNKDFGMQDNYVELPHKQSFLNCGFKCPHCSEFYHSHYDHPELIKRREVFKHIKAPLKLQKSQRKYELLATKAQKVAEGL